MGTMNILEINQKKLSLLDVSQLTAFLNIFKGVSNPKAKQIVKDLGRELSTRKTEEVEEAAIKDIIKLVKASAKKIGGIIDKVMGDAEFQKAYAKYIDNPNDKDRLKKIQAYTNGLLGDGTSESVQLKRLRIEKVCSIVLGEDFDQDFIYEDVDFTKPSIVKEAYSTYLIEASKGDIKKVLDAAKKAGGTVKGNQIDFGMGAVIDVSVEKGKIKLDAGLSNGVEYFKNAKDAIMAFESVELEEAFSRLPGNIINNELYTVEKDLKAFVSSQRNGNDVNEKQLNSIIKNLQSIKREIKKFNKPEDVPVRYQYKESTDLEEAKKYEAGKYYAKFGGRVVGPYDTEKDAYHDTKGDIEWIKKGKDIKESTELEEAIKVKTHRGMYSMKKGEQSLRHWVDGIVIMSDAVKKNQRKTVAQNIVKAIESGKIKNADLTQDLGALIGIKSPKGMEAPTSVIKAKLKDLGLSESTDLEEASDKDLDIKSIKDLIKNPSPKMIKQYGGKDKYIKMLKSKLAKLESTEIEEANNRLVAHTPAAAQRLIKKLKNKFSGYTWDQRIKGNEVIYPMEPHIIRFIKKQPEVATI